jgi:hypothetical protein
MVGGINRALKRRRLAPSLATIVCASAIGVLLVASTVRAQSRDAESFDGVPLLGEPSNLAAGANGARAYELGTGADAGRLIDGKPADGWFGSTPFDESSPIDLVVGLTASDPAIAATDILIRPRHWQRGARPPQTIEILILENAAGGDFISAGTFRLADAPGWQRLTIAATVARQLKIRILSVHGTGRPAIGEVAVFAGPPTIATAEAPDVVSVEPKDERAITPLARSGRNDVLRLALHGYSTAPDYLGETAPDGMVFLALRGSIENLSSEKPLALPSVEDVFSLSLGLAGITQPHEVNRLGAYPFTGPVEIPPGRRKPFTLVFATADPPGEETALVFSGTTAGGLALPLFQDSPSDDATKALAEASSDTLLLAVKAFQLASATGGIDAPAGYQFAYVDIDIERRGETALVSAFAEYAMLVEDNQYAYPPHQSDQPLSPHLYKDLRYNPGVVVSGHLVFLMPLRHGDLNLVYFTADGPLVLDLTPEVEPATKPATLAGPSSDGLIMANLLGVSQHESATPGNRVFALDVELMLTTEERDVAFPFDPQEALQLRDGQGRFYNPLPDEEGFRRALRKTLIWHDQSARGEVAFEVGENVSGLTLVIPFRDNPVELVLPDELFGTPPDAVEPDPVEPEIVEPEIVELDIDETDIEVDDPAGEGAPLVASNLAWAAEIDGTGAGVGQRFLSFDLTFTNRDAGHTIAQAIADYALVVEDGQYTYPAHPLTADLGSMLSVAQAVGPGQSLSGHLVYELPETTGSLALVYFGPDGPVELDLTPELAAVPAPTVAASQTIELASGGTELTIIVFDPVAVDLGAPPVGEHYVVADFALQLDSANPLATLPIDPSALFTARDQAGNSFHPATVALPRSFEKTELWAGQTSRGLLAFLVPTGAEAPTALTLELGKMASLPLPLAAVSTVMVEPEETVVAEKEVLSLDLAPVETSGVCELGVADDHPRVLFLGADTVTHGNWPGRYGSDGYALIAYDGGGNDRRSLPPYLDSYVFSDNTGFHIWNGATPDPRAPASLTGERVAATAVSNPSFSLTVTVTDASPHTLALYFLDWDSDARTQDIAVYDAATDELLDQRNLAHFRGGTYFVYEVRGNVRIEIIHTGGANAILSGIFWDPPKPNDVAAVLENTAGDGERDGVFFVRRGDKTFRFAVTGNLESDARASSPGLIGRYMTGPGYGQILVERQDPTLDFSWWHGPPGGFPDEESYPVDEILWAEWEGELLAPWMDSDGILSLANDQAPGLVLGRSPAGVCVESVEATSPAAVAGLQAGDIIIQATDDLDRISNQVDLRLDAPAGGYLYIDGLRVLTTESAPVEASLELDYGTLRLRVAARRGGSRAVAEEASEDPPPGPKLSWRLPSMSTFEPIPSLSLLARSAPGNLRREPRQAAQVGLDWLQSGALDWQRTHQCFGCHVQAQALVAMAIGRDNEYDVSDVAYTDMLDALVAYQNADGTWHDGYYVTSTQYGTMALAAAHHRGKDGRNDSLLPAVRYLMEVQDEDGRIPLDHDLRPMDQGDFMPTANARVAFSVAADLATPAEARTIRDAETKALNWLATAEPVTNQDRAMRILGLATEDRKNVREILSAARFDLLERQREDGGWAETDVADSSGFATGQSLYVLKVAGQSVASAPFQRGVNWLLEHQLWTGAWKSTSQTQFAGTMWPVIALVGSFQAAGVEIAADSCLEGDVDLAAKVVSDEAIELVRFLIDNEVVGSSRLADSEGLYSVAWDAETVAYGAHELRIEAIQEGAVRGEDQTDVHTGPIGSHCAGTLNVFSTGEAIAGAAAPNIELILDASGSMKERKRRVDGKLKIDVAKELMAETIAGLPDGIMVGLRVYGQNIHEGRDGDCHDSELVLPFSKLDKARLTAEVSNVQALGTTPLAYSLLQAARDLADLPGEKLILLVTDGKEECGGSAQDVATRLAELGMTLRVDVVGFALAEESVKQEMERVAEITGGRFFDAQNSDELREGIRRSLAAPYVVVGQAGESIGSGVTDRGAIALPAGLYTVTVGGVDEEITVVNVRIGYDRATGVALTKAGAIIETEVLGPIATDDADWDATPIGASESVPAAAATPQTPQTPEQVAALKAALDAIEQDLEEARTRAPVVVVDPRIRGAQEMLAALGFEPGPADGLWGGKTANAVTAFQAWYPLAALTVTGKIDDQTYNAMQEATAQGLRLVEIEPAPPIVPDDEPETVTEIEPEVAPEVEPKVLPEFEPEIEPEVVPTLSGIPSVLDSGTLVVGGVVVQLEGVIGELGGHEAGLATYLDGRSVDCRPIGARYRCKLQGYDLSEIVLFNGAGRATPDASPALKEAEANARDAGRGVWQ